MFLAGRWYRLTIQPELVPKDDPIGRLPVTLLARHVLEPLLSDPDQRTDKRIDFIGGARSANARSSSAKWQWRSRSTQMTAGGGRCSAVRPPEAIRFEPKLADGVVNHVLD